MTWNKSKIGEHTPVDYNRVINDRHPANVQRNGQVDHDFFTHFPELVQCFLVFCFSYFGIKLQTNPKKNIN